MSGLSINFNEIKPEDVQEKIDFVIKILSYAKILDQPKLNVVCDFLTDVLKKPFVPKLIAVVLEAFNENWSGEIHQLLSDLK